MASESSGLHRGAGPSPKVARVLAVYACAILGASTGCASKHTLDAVAVANVKRIAFVSFAVAGAYTVGSGEDAKVTWNSNAARTFGKYHLDEINARMKDTGSLFLDMNEMFNSQGFRSLKSSDSYTRCSSWLPAFLEDETRCSSWLPAILASETRYLSPIEGRGVVSLDPDTAARACKALTVDAVLGAEVSYSMGSGFSIPFIKPSWHAAGTVTANLYDARGNLIWKDHFTRQAPLKVKATTSTNLILFSNSSITAAQTVQLIEAVVKDTSSALISDLKSDLTARLK